MDFRRKVLRTIRKWGMLKGVKKLALGLSGGKDSGSLALVLSGLPVEVFPIFFDEGTDYRRRALAIARRLSTDLGLSLTVVRIEDVLGRPLSSFRRKCAVCGLTRRRVLNLEALSLGAQKLATGHTLDDLAESVLLNLVRNEPERMSRTLPSLPSIHPLLVPRIKPLAEVRNQETAEFFRRAGYPVLPKECPWRSSSFRFAVRKGLEAISERIPQAAQNLVNAVFSADWPRAEAGLRECENCGQPTPHRLCALCRILKEEGATDALKALAEYSFTKARPASSASF